MRYRDHVAQKRSDPGPAARARGESPAETLDRNVAEALQEMRVAITGVQVLFAFLLTLPFQARFGDLGGFGTAVYAVTMISTSCATVVLIAPVAFHRILFRQRQKPAVVAFADRSLLIGLTLLLIGICSAVLLVLEVVLGRGPASWVCAGVSALGLLTWFALPLRRRARRDG